MEPMGHLASKKRQEGVGPYPSNARTPRDAFAFTKLQSRRALQDLKHSVRRRHATQLPEYGEKLEARSAFGRARMLCVKNRLRFDAELPRGQGKKGKHAPLQHIHGNADAKQTGHSGGTRPPYLFRRPARLSAVTPQNGFLAMRAMAGTLAGASGS